MPAGTAIPTEAIERMVVAEGVRLEVDISRDLLNWDEQAVLLDEDPVGDGLVEARYRDTQPLSEGGRRYLRMRIEVE